jgi:hypothetical protein
MTSFGSIGSMLRKTLFFSSLIGAGSKAVGGSIAGAFRDMVVTHLFQILAFMRPEAQTSAAKSEPSIPEGD